MANVVDTIESSMSAYKLMSLNIQNLPARSSDIMADRVLMMVDMLAISETWEEGEIGTGENGFVCISSAKRPEAREAGVAIFQNRTATTMAIPHSIRKLSDSYDVELGLADNYGDICAAEITITNSPVILLCIYISPGMQPLQILSPLFKTIYFVYSIDTTIKQKKFFLVRNLILYFNESAPMILTGNFNVDISKQENMEFVEFMKKYLRLELVSDPTQATTLDGSCVDLTFSRNIHVKNMRSYSCFCNHRPMLTVFEEPHHSFPGI